MIRVITYNIRYNTARDGENAWPHRKDRVAQLLHQYEPDLIGLQEVKQDQLTDLIQRLPDFAWVGVGRDDGKTAGEYAPIFYRRARFRLKENGTFWLSQTPNIIGSVGWDASMARIATWAKFVDLQTETILLQLNTHFDHRGMESQIHAAHLLRTFLAEQPQPSPILITGDFNCTEESATYEALTLARAHKAPPLIDTMHATQTPHIGPLATFNNDFADPLQAKIDYIFIQHQPDNPIQVQRHVILADKQNGRYPSDHLPIMVETV